VDVLDICDREVGQGGEVRWRKAGVIRQSAPDGPQTPFREFELHLNLKTAKIGRRPD
jgi:hypothetical protein